MALEKEILERGIERQTEESELLLQEIISYTGQAEQKIYLEYRKTAQKIMSLRKKHGLHHLNEKAWEKNEHVAAYLKDFRLLVAEADIDLEDRQLLELFEQTEMLSKEQSPLTPYFILLNIADLENAILRQIEARVAYIPLC